MECIFLIDFLFTIERVKLLLIFLNEKHVIASSSNCVANLFHL